MFPLSADQVTITQGGPSVSAAHLLSSRTGPSGHTKWQVSGRKEIVTVP